MMAYLAMMAPRLGELHRVLKEAGSLYLHCDPTASHYLKMLLDSIFGPGHFQNEIIWKRTTTKNDYAQGATNWPRIHDVILYYSKTPASTHFSQPFAPLDQNYIQTHYRLKDEQGRQYQLDNLTAPGAGSRGHPQYEFMGVTRYWRYNKEKMERLRAEGRIIQPRPGAVPRYKRYLDEMKGVAVGDLWWDISPINSQAQERIGYPTQKPQALLERIIAASSKHGDVVLDPFCGCGTAIEAAHKLQRVWIGIDITPLAIGVVKNRMQKAFGPTIADEYKTIYEPRTVDAARALAEEDAFEFQCWVVEKLGGSAADQRRGADRGIDGRVFFRDEASGPSKHIVVSVKSGKHLSPSFVRDLRGTMERDKAAMGVLVCLEKPTKAMEREAIGSGDYKSLAGTFPRVQVITVDNILSGAGLIAPPIEKVDASRKRPPGSSGPSEGQLRLPGMR